MYSPVLVKIFVLNNQYQESVRYAGVLHALTFNQALPTGLQLVASRGVYQFDKLDVEDESRVGWDDRTKATRA